MLPWDRSEAGGLNVLLRVRSEAGGLGALLYAAKCV